MDTLQFAILLALALLQLGATLTLLHRRRGPQPQPEQREKPHTAADPIDEGFENIMRFSVCGRTGFEPE